MKRSPLQRRTPLRRGGRRRRHLVVPLEVREQVAARSAGRCVVCGGRGTHPHHILPKSRWPEFAKVADNMVWTCLGCHDEHERAHHRIPLEALPLGVMAFAASRAAAYVAVTYPVRWAA